MRTQSDPLLLEQLLLREYGALVDSSATAHLLGYRTSAALSKARQRGRLPVPMQTIPGRRGWFATTADIARWLTDRQDTSSFSEGAAMT